MSSDDHHASAGNDKSTLGSLKEQAGEKVSQVADTLKDEAARREEGIRGSLSKQADQLASALRSAKSEIDPDSSIGRMFDYAADSVGSLAQSMKSTDTTDIVHSVRDFARERPGAFLGICALGGFAAARFLLASAPEGGQQGAGSRSGLGYAGSSSGSGYSGNARSYRTMSGSGSQARTMTGSMSASGLGTEQAGMDHGGTGAPGNTTGFGTSSTSMAGSASGTGSSGISTGGTGSGTTPSGSSIGGTMPATGTSRGGSGAGSEVGGDLSGQSTDQGSAGGASQSQTSRDAPALGGHGGRDE